MFVPDAARQLLRRHAASPYCSGRRSRAGGSPPGRASNPKRWQRIGTMNHCGRVGVSPTQNGNRDTRSLPDVPGKDTPQSFSSPRSRMGGENITGVAGLGLSGAAMAQPVQGHGGDDDAAGDDFLHPVSQAHLRAAGADDRHDQGAHERAQDRAFPA